MNFKAATEKCLKHYVIFSGRAQRSEYWYFVLFNFIVGLFTGFLDGILFYNEAAQGSFQPISNIATLALLLPGIAVGVRRLHDTNRSGWWLLIGFTVVGLIPLIYWYCTRGTVGDNRFGPDPLGEVVSSLTPPAPPTQSQQL